MPGDITLVQQVAMPPNAWTGAVGEGLVADLNVHFTDKVLQTTWKSHGTMALPIAHYSTKTTSGWMMNKDVESLSVTVHKEPSFLSLNDLLSNADCTKDIEETTTEIHLPTAPSLLEVTASSSGAGGFVASPALLRSQAFLPKFARIAHWLVQCTASSLVDLSVPQRGMVDHETNNAAFPTFRFIDGGFVENTALASTIGKLHADNPTETHLGNFIHFDLDTPFYDGDDLKSHVAALFSMRDGEVPNQVDKACNTPKELCIDPAAPGQKNAQNIGRPVSTIFENVWPDVHNEREDEWTEYASHEDCRRPLLKFADECTTIKSYYWKGTMTTIENKWYGVPAGLKLELLVFASNEPTSTIMVGNNNMGDTGQAVGGRAMWESVYGPIAKEQAEGAEQVIKDFLN